MKTIKMKFVIGLALCLLFSSVQVSEAEEGLFVVQSETDGAGRFTYTITGTNDVYVWGIPENGIIIIPSHCVETASGPDGWIATVEPNGWVTWEYTNGTWFVEEDPLVLVIHSKATNSTEYAVHQPSFFLPGMAVGYAYTNNVSVIPGVQRFSIIGPKPVPRISSFSVVDNLMHMSIQEMAGSTCIVERTTNLVDPEWQEFTNIPVAGYSTNLTCLIDTNTIQSAFYRLRLIN
jgi:hypothetical protein